jgi:hypothetical protein
LDVSNDNNHSPFLMDKDARSFSLLVASVAAWYDLGSCAYLWKMSICCLAQASMVLAQRIVHQPQRARGITSKHRQDLAREAVGWMRVLGRALRALELFRIE